MTLWSSRQDKTRLLTRLLLVCLPGDTARRPRLNRSLLLETASSARCLRFGCEFLQCFHRYTILQSGLVCSMEKDPMRTGVSVHCSSDVYDESIGLRKEPTWARQDHPAPLQPPLPPSTAPYKDTIYSLARGQSTSNCCRGRR